jgi:hypothetical protein
LDETSGTGAYLKDVSGNGYDGTPVNTSYSFDAKSVGSRYFDGSGDYVDVGNRANLNPTDAITVDAWVKPTQTSAWMGIATKRGLSGSDIQYYLQTMATTNQYTFGVNVGGVDYGTAGGTVTFGKWTHVVGTYDASGTLRLYVDGVLASERTDQSGSMSVNGLPVVIGARADGSSPFSGRTDFWKGWIDEVRISNTARPADWVAEQVRMGRDHRLERTIPTTDLTSSGKLPYWVAADRPGTYLEAVIGESSYADYMPDANTKLLLHMEEAAGTGAYVKDSSSNDNHGTPGSGSTSVTSGKIGHARNFNATANGYVSVADANSLDLTDNFTIDAWIYRTAASGDVQIIERKIDSVNDTGYQLLLNSDGRLVLQFGDGGGGWPYGTSIGNTAVGLNQWHHLAVSRSGTSVKYYIDGLLDATTTVGANPAAANAETLYLGNKPDQGTTYALAARLDEFRISNSVRTAAEIRQAYEYGRRSHAVTIDFAAKLDSGNLIAGPSDLSFTVDGTYFGLVYKASHLNEGDIVMIRENVGGTEYLAQARAVSTNWVTGAVTVPAWIVGSTFPDGGFSANATVMKWQRIYWDISNVIIGTGSGDSANQKDAVTKVGLRLSEANLGRTVYLDDLRSVTSYLTGSGASGNITSSPGQYIQYQIIYSGSTGASSGALAESGGGSSSGGNPPSPQVDDVVIDYTETILVSAGHAPTSPTVYNPVSFTATASVPSGITKMELYLDGLDPADLIHTCNFSPAQSPVYCNYGYGLMTGGSHTLRAVAYSAFSDASVADTFSVARITTSNTLSVERAKVDVDTVYSMNFTLAELSTGTLTVTFPEGFSMVSPATAEASDSCFSNFSMDVDNRRLIATKTNCLGPVTFSGAVVHTPIYAGSYTVTWTNDNGEGVLFITDDDAVNVTGNIDPTLTFDIDVSLADGDSIQPYIVDLGGLSSAAPRGSDGSSVSSVWLDLETNATGGATVTVRSANAALKSVSSPSDAIVSATETLAANDEGYGLCVAGVSGTFRSEMPATTFTAQAPYASTCIVGGYSIGRLQTGDQSLLIATGPLAAGRAQLRIAASVTNGTAAHPDYTDLLTFIATATY